MKRWLAVPFLLALPAALIITMSAPAQSAVRSPVPESHGATTWYVGQANGVTGEINSWSWKSTPSHGIRLSNQAALANSCLPQYAYLKVRYLATDGVTVIKSNNSPRAVCPGYLTSQTGSNGLYAKAQVRIISDGGGVSRQGWAWTTW